jgi:hypothetical protein
MDSFGKTFDFLAFFDLRPEHWVSIFRALLGSIVAFDNLIGGQQRLDLYHRDGIYPREIYDRFNPSPPFIRVFDMFGQSISWIRAVHAFAVLGGVLLSLGFLTPFVAAFLWIIQVSKYNRNPYALQGGETLLRLILLPLIFFPVQGGWSLDSTLGLFSEWGHPNALFLVKLQLSALYFRSTYWKLQRPLWRNGLMMNRVLDASLARPWLWIRSALSYRWSCAMVTWLVMVVQSFIVLGLWWAPTKGIALLFSTALQLGIMMILRIGSFQPLVISLGILFLV